MAPRLKLLGCSLLIAVFACGCAEKGPKRYPVRGEVRLDGQPLAAGTIYFKTIQTGDLDSIPVKDGKFEGQAAEGKRRVEVVAYRLVPVAGEMGGEVQESLVAPRYNMESTLTADVTSSGPNEFKFDVESK